MQRYKQALGLTICFFYFSPLFIVSRTIPLSSQILTLMVTWSLLGLGAIACLWKYYENRVKKNWESSQQSNQILKDKFDNIEQMQVTKEHVAMLMRELHQKDENEKVLQRRLDQLNHHHLQEIREFTDLNKDLQEQLTKRESSLSESRLTLKEQRRVIEKKQEEINILKIQVNDFKYEIESILKLKNQPAPAAEPIKIQTDSKSEASTQGLSLKDKLQRYIDLSMNITQSNPFAAPQNGYRLPIGALVIDQRRLFDRLQAEETDVILVYSQEDEKLVFVNKQIQELLGWRAEKFLKDFSFLVEKGLSNWQETLKGLQDGYLGEVRLLMKTRSGENLLTHCYLKVIPKGAFEGHVLGILTSAANR